MEPQMHTDAHRLNALTEAIIGCLYRVQNVLGCGFLEKVYENAVVHELGKTGLTVEQQKRIPVYYDQVVVGEYVCDLLVEGCVKAVAAVDNVHKAQCINYLKASDLPICLLVNFGSSRLQVKRFLGPKAKNLFCVNLCASVVKKKSETDE